MKYPIISRKAFYLKNVSICTMFLLHLFTFNILILFLLILRTAFTCFFFFLISYLLLFHFLHYCRSYTFYPFWLLVFITYMMINLHIFNLLINKYLRILKWFIFLWHVCTYWHKSKWDLITVLYKSRFRFSELFIFCAFHPLLHFRSFIWESLSFWLEYILYNSL